MSKIWYLVMVLTGNYDYCRTLLDYSVGCVVHNLAVDLTETAWSALDRLNSAWPCCQLVAFGNNYTDLFGF